MVQPNKFKTIEFEWDEHNLHEVFQHAVAPDKAEFCFFNAHRVYRNKKKLGRTYETFKLEGRTDNGRKLLVIFFVKEKVAGSALVRVITAWERGEL